MFKFRPEYIKKSTGSWNLYKETESKFNSIKQKKNPKTISWFQLCNCHLIRWKFILILMHIQIIHFSLHSLFHPIWKNPLFIAQWNVFSEARDYCLLEHKGKIGHVVEICSRYQVWQWVKSALRKVHPWTYNMMTHIPKYTMMSFSKFK